MQPVTAASGPAQSESGEVTPLEIEAGFSFDALTNGLSDWTSYFLEGSKKLSTHTTAYGLMRETNRFSLHDQEALAGIYHALDPQWTILFEAQTGILHRVLPKWSLMGEVEYLLAQGWGTSVGVRQTEYSTASVTRTYASIEHYWTRFRGAYTFSLTNVESGGSLSSHRVHLSYYYGSRNSIGLIYASGNEAEMIAMSGVLVYKTTTIVLVGRYWFSDHWAWTHELSFSTNEGLYTRRGARLGLRYAF
jgi:YaiO family outer membrane protein